MLFTISNSVVLYEYPATWEPANGESLMSPITLYPPFLNQGSRGAAVLHLQQMMSSMGFATAALICDADYTEGGETAKSVQRLQNNLEIEDDGHFGPGTRIAFKRKFGIDVDAIPHENQRGERAGQTVWVDGNGKKRGVWRGES